MRKTLDQPKDFWKRLANALRQAYVLPILNSMFFLPRVLRSRKANARFVAEHPGFIPPPAALAYDAFGELNWRGYHDVGIRHARMIGDQIRAYVSSPDIRVCEWGCGPARVIQHLRALDRFSKVELVGTDYNTKTISWCKENFKDIEFHLNRLEPPLPLQSEQFDCVYAISVFTHLSEKMHYLWMQELLRIVKPGGVLIFTTQGDGYVDALLPDERSRYDAGNIVVRGKVEEGKKHYCAFHPPRFITGELLKGHDVLKHLPSPIDYELFQDLWVLRKNGSDRELGSPE